MVHAVRALNMTSWSSKTSDGVQNGELVTEPRTVDELIRARARELPNQALVSYPHHGLDYVDYTANQLDQYAYHAARRYADMLQPRTRSSEKALVVGLLGLSSLDYLITAMAILKLGHTVLHLSTRISHEAYVDLLRSTQTHVLLVDETTQSVASKCMADISSLQTQRLSRASDYMEPLQSNLDTNMTPTLDVDVEQETVAWIIHSSGSTGLPKPIYQTHRAAMNNYRGNMNMRGFITLPLFHSHGISSTYRAIYSGKQIHMYNANIPLTKQHLIEVMRRHQFEIFYGVPYVLQLLAETQEGIELLARCQIVMFGGSVCPDELGDKLVESGVHLVSHWGSTETGQLMTSFRPFEDKSWNYLRPSENVKPYLRMEDRGEGLFEAVCLAGWPSKVATNRLDGSYAMKDLFTKHPSQDWWKYYGRLDDTIVLVNGEKAMPLPIEGAARQHSMIAEAVVFGKGRDRLGLALILSSAAASKSSGEIVEDVLKLIEKTQLEMPAYARISSDMVLLLDPDTDYPRTDKGTVIRIKFYNRFEQQIDALYESINNQRGTQKLSEHQLRNFLQPTLKALSASVEVSDHDQDFFNAGMDSLQASRMRAAISKDIDVGDNQLGINVTFEHPTISKLARHLYDLRMGFNSQAFQASIEDRIQELMDRYSVFEHAASRSQALRSLSEAQSDISVRHTTARSRTSQASSVILTGVTGSLGAHMIPHLAQDPSIVNIYCLIRASSNEEAQERLSKSLVDRGITELIISDPSKLIALATDLTKPDLGLSSTILENLRTTTTSIIHSAWSVNFNLSLSSFEDCIASAHNLLKFALSTSTSTPTTFNFCSSVSTVMRTPSSSPSEAHIPETVPPLSHAQSMGYAQSKLVTEHLCAKVARRYNLPTRVLRIGQIIGDTTQGVWNKREAIPTMMQTAITIGALPTLDENVRWLPVDIVAKSCVDIALRPVVISTSTNPHDAEVYNVLNPHTVHWTKDLLPLLRAQGLAFDALPAEEWLGRLQASEQDPGVNPPIKLLDFWMGKYARKTEGDSAQGRKLKYSWATSNTVQASPVSASVDRRAVLDVVKLSLDYFRSRCW